jgi:hypothetical protein
MAGALLRRRGHRRLPSALSGRERPRPAAFRPADHVARLRAATSKGGDAEACTLEEVITGAWHALSVWETAQCPLCGGEMRRGETAVASTEVEDAAPHGLCTDCGTQLS